MTTELARQLTTSASLVTIVVKSVSISITAKVREGQRMRGRVGDVYEVAGQLIKCAYYCDVPTLINHMRVRMNPARHTSPSSFVTGTLDEVEALLTTTLPTKLSFCVVGVQPGIRRTMVNERLSDLMAFCIGYVRGGGTAKAYWLVSE
ncbi:hypothetical protein N5K55_09920 [Pseudomonas aeruginosa]|nr:hypothetical protein [Pseudomonas aeruginosa]